MSAFGTEVQRYRRLFKTEIEGGKYRRTIDGNTGSMRFALEIEKTTPFMCLSFGRRLRILADAPAVSLSAALRSETTVGADDHVFALTAYALAHAALRMPMR